MRFVVDCNVGKLARWLRVAGFDTLFFKDIDDNRLVRVAVDEGRVLFDGSPRRLLSQEMLLERLGLELPEIVKLSEVLVSSGFVEAREATSVGQLLELLDVVPCSDG